MARVGDRIVERLDSMKQELVECLQGLVRIESVNPAFSEIEDRSDLVGGEGQAAAYLASVYREFATRVEAITVEPGRENAAAVVEGAGGGRSLILNGHVDVVPGGPPEAWEGADPFSARVDGLRMWGRGTADQKSGLVAQAMAASALVREGVRLKGDLILQAVVGEESMEHEKGVTAVLDHGYAADAAIVSEPTSRSEELVLSPVTAGGLAVQLRVHGKASHACNRGAAITPGRIGSPAGVNAIEKMIVVMRGLRDLEKEWAWTKSHPLFPAGHFTLSPGPIVGQAEGILSSAAVADLCTAEYTCWYPPDVAPEQVKSEICDRVDAVARLDSWLRFNPPEMRWLLHWPPTTTSTRHPLVENVAEAHRRVTGRSLTTENGGVAGFGAVCDGAFLERAGIPTVVFGPGSLLQAHAVDEFVDLGQVLDAAKAYAYAAILWCGGLSE